LFIKLKIEKKELKIEKIVRSSETKKIKTLLIMKQHTKNSRPSNWDKHSKKQKSPSNNKKYKMFDFFLGKRTGRNENK
jgi:hypothetical protein